MNACALRFKSDTAGRAEGESPLLKSGLLKSGRLKTGSPAFKRAEDKGVVVDLAGRINLPAKLGPVLF